MSDAQKLRKRRKAILTLKTSLPMKTRWWFILEAVISSAKPLIITGRKEGVVKALGG